MTPDVVTPLLALALPTAYLAVAAYVRLAPLGHPGRSAAPAIAAGGAALLFAVVLAAITASTGSRTVGFTLAEGVSPSFRFDWVSLPILCLVTFVGFVVLRFSRNYLDGDPRQHIFYSRLLVTLAATVVLTMAGDLVVFAAGWMALSLVLHKLLVFYADRPLAVLAARKKFIAARFSDLCVLSAFALLWVAGGTTDIAALASAAAAGTLGNALLPAALLIAFAALTKSAQWPFHGWITEVMETPTPVSALLHAGIVNAGGFAVLRFSDLFVAATPSLWLLAMVGGGTALFASIVMLTQPRIKTQLAWSTIAQMGFMLLQCGIGAFSSAMLHIIAHSLYKAHAFLWAGSAVEQVKPAASVTVKPGHVAASLGMAAVIFAAAGAAFGATLWDKPALIVLGSVVVLAMMQTLAMAFAQGAGGGLVARITARMAFVAVSYFALQLAVLWLLAGSVAAAPETNVVAGAIMVLTLVSFAALSILQALGLHFNPPRWLNALHVHASNGFYANAAFNRIAGALTISTAGRH